MAARDLPREDSILLDNVSVSVTNESGDPVPVLQDIELQLAPGEWLYVVGTNGSGKSTLARLLAGLYLEGTSGLVTRGFAGETASPVVLQRPEAQLFGESPREELMFASEWRQVPAVEIASRIDQVLAMTGLQHLADAPWDRLSGGQKQLAAVAAAAVADSPMIVFDEATSMLDEANREAVLELARSWHRRGAAIVWVTQRLDEMLPNQRVIALTDGRITYDGDVRSFFYGAAGEAGAIDKSQTKPTPCEQCGLRLPYLSALALQLQRRGRLVGPLPVTQQEWREVWGNEGRKAAGG